MSAASRPVVWPRPSTAGAAETGTVTDTASLGSPDSEAGSAYTRYVVKAVPWLIPASLYSPI